MRSGAFGREDDLDLGEEVCGGRVWEVAAHDGVEVFLGGRLGEDGEVAQRGVPRDVEPVGRSLSRILEGPFRILPPTWTRVDWRALNSRDTLNCRFMKKQTPRSLARSAR